VIVVKKSCLRRRFLAVERLVGRSVYEIDIQPAVVVIVQQTNAWAFCLQDEALCRRTGRVMPARKACCLGNILENDRA